MGTPRRRSVLLVIAALAGAGLALVPAGPASAVPTSVSLTVSDTTPAPQDSITLTATANDTVSGSGLTIQIWDTSRNAYVTQCTTGNTCGTTMALPSTIRQHTFRAYLAPSRTPQQGPPTSFTAASSSVSVEWERRWRSISPSTAPAARFGAHMAYHAAEGVTVLFGGCKKHTPTDLVVVLDDGTVKNQDDAAICKPADQLDDTWVFNGATETWTQVTPSGGPPHKRFLGSMAYDYTSDSAVLYGGLYQADDGSAPTADTINCHQQGETSYGVPGVQSVHDGAGNEVEAVCFGDTWTLRKVSGAWTWAKLTPVGNPGARFDAAMAFDAAGRPTLVGGCEGIGYLGSHQKPTVPTEWGCSDFPEVEKEIVGPGCSPFPPLDPEHPEGFRNDYLTTDPLGETCVLREIEHTDSWRLGWTADPAAGGTPVWTQVGCFEEEITADKLCAPPEVRGASLTLDPVTRKLVLYGGHYYEPRIYYRGFLGDTWEFDGDTWTMAASQGAQDQWCPSRAANKAWMGAAAVYLGGWQVMNVAGEGAYYSADFSCPTTTGDAQQDPWGDGSRPINDRTWADSWRWDGNRRAAGTCPFSGGTHMCWYPLDEGAPTRRAAPSMAFDHVNGKAVLFGGICAKPSSCPSSSLLLGLGDTWVFDAQSASDPCGASCGSSYTSPPGGGTWEQETQLPLPGGLWGPAVAEDPVRGNAVLFGGCKAGNPCASASNETWVWDGDVWVRVPTTVQPSARFGARLAWDDVDKVLVLFGGATTTGIAPNDTWVWNGSTWSQRAPLTSPSSRIWHGMDTDATGRPLLFGGCSFSCNPISNETWRWNGTTWTNPCGTAVCAGGPGPQLVADHLASDHSGKVLLLVGSQTWSWSGTAWSDVTPATQPPLRSAGAMAKADFGGTWGVLLFGGAGTGGTMRNDTWLFTYNAAGTGGVWSQVICDCVPPPARQTAALAPSPADGRLVLFGGLNAGVQPMGDTWSF